MKDALILNATARAEFSMSGPSRGAQSTSAGRQAGFRVGKVMLVALAHDGHCGSNITTITGIFSEVLSGAFSRLCFVLPVRKAGVPSGPTLTPLPRTGPGS